jgi:hypothetical protein
VLAVVSASASSVEAQVAGPTRAQCLGACIGKLKDCEFEAKCLDRTNCLLKDLFSTRAERLKKCQADHSECLGACTANITGGR